VEAEAVDRLLIRAQYAEASRQCYEALRHVRGPEEWELRYLLGLCQLKLNRFEEAKGQFTIVLAGKPDRELAELALLGLGDASLLAEAFDEALRYYERFLSRHEDSPFCSLAVQGMARAYLRSGRWDQGERVLRRVIRDYPKSAEADWSRRVLEDGLGFTVQVAALADRGKASSLVEELRQKGFAGFLAETLLRGRQVYRVRVGPLRSRDEAQAIQRALTEAGYAARMYP
jgi:tetratricopeptide (TPR) repeat protein